MSPCGEGSGWQRPGHGMLARNGESPAGRVFRRSLAEDSPFLASGCQRRQFKLEEREGVGWQRNSFFYYYTLNFLSILVFEAFALSRFHLVFLVTSIIKTTRL